MLPTTHAEENGLPILLFELAVFLTHASLAPHGAANSELFQLQEFRKIEIVGCEGERIQSEGFNFGAHIPIHRISTILSNRN